MPNIAPLAPAETAPLNVILSNPPNKPEIMYIIIYFNFPKYFSALEPNI